VNPEKVFVREDYYNASIELAGEELKSRIIAYAGCSSPINPRIMRRVSDGEKSGHPMYIMDFAIPVGEPITLYVDIPPPRSLSEWVESIEWDFGDGSRGSGRILEHTYGMPGSYTVRASIRFRSGATITVTSTVNVYVRLEFIGGLALISIGAVAYIAILLRRRRLKIARLT
ncbi:MAG: PKD domain-containing protein, partial [Candidatus Bathyarchaeota archaeon]|nr:PKD domain-containing protein [Candidatus Bathyarchaeota archaeon]